MTLISTPCSIQKTTTNNLDKVNTKHRPRVCRIHVSQPAIRENLKKAKQGERGYAPVITVKRGDQNVYGHEVQILDKEGNVIAVVMQPEDRQLSCGARVWIETYAPVRVVEVDRNTVVLER